MAQYTGFNTIAVHTGQDPDPLTGAVIPPIYQTSTFVQDGINVLRAGHEYSRGSNPTRNGFEAQLAALEEHSAAARAAYQRGDTAAATRAANSSRSCS